jgi:hypothetical protein
MRDERFVKPTGPDWITGEAGRQRMVTDRELDSFANVGSHLDLREQYSAANPVVPTHRLTEIDAKSHGYSYPLALKRLRKLISEP